MSRQTDRQGYRTLQLQSHRFGCQNWHYEKVDGRNSGFYVICNFEKHCVYMRLFLHVPDN